MQGEIVSKWCRENLNEIAAEKELRTNRKGTFLVWKCRSPVDLYLSFFDHEGTIHHLPIKQLGRFFFLEGGKFRSLPELVIHHLTMREFSHNPVKIVNSHKRDKLEATHIALVDMDNVPGQPPFSVARGDLLAEVGRIDDRWLLAKHLPTESIAFFDLTQTVILSDMDVTPEALPYFHECSAGPKGEDQEELVARLAEGGGGSFLLRRSRQSTGAYALLVHTGDKIDKFLLEDVKGQSSSSSPSLNNNNDNNNSSSIKTNGATTSGWRLSGRIFPSISQIVHRYSIRAIQAEARLTHAVLSARSEEGISSSCSSTSSPSTSNSSATTTSTGGEEKDMQERESDRVAGERVVVASVSALYKSREDKEWRACKLTLYEHAGTAILRISDTTARSDRQTLVLHHTELVCLHESMLGREATVYLAPLQSEPGVFFAFEPLHFFYTWFHLLRRYTVQRRSESSFPSPTLSPLSFYSAVRESTHEMSLLSLHVDKYRGTPLKSDASYRVGISLNGVGLAATAYQSPTSGNSVVFDAHFLMIVTSCSCNLQLTISASGKSRPTAISSVMAVPAGGMTSSSSSSSSSSTSSGSSTTAVERKTSNAMVPPTPFVVTSNRQKVIVLSREAYSPLLESLLDEVLRVAEWASGRLPGAQRNLLCSVVVSLVWPHSLRALIERTLGRRIRETGEGNLLRQDSFASCLITAALRLAGKTMLEAALGEERPKKEVASEDWLVSLLSSLARVPAVSLVLACVAATVAAHLPAANKEYVVRRAVSAAFVLRFANPLIISSLSSSVEGGGGGGGAGLAKAIQTAANAATMQGFVRNASGEGTPTRLFDLFERVRESAAQPVIVEAYDTAPEQCALLCHLLASALSVCPTTCRNPPPIPFSTTSSSSSSTITTSSSAASSMTSSTLGGAESMTTMTAETSTDGVVSSSLSIVSSSSSSTTTSHGHPELTPRLARLLELHRS